MDLIDALHSENYVCDSDCFFGFKEKHGLYSAVYGCDEPVYFFNCFEVWQHDDVRAGVDHCIDLFFR